MSFMSQKINNASKMISVIKYQSIYFEHSSTKKIIWDGEEGKVFVMALISL